jgi:RNA polymerase sigma-70 factor (ECF subfamily)
MIPPLLPVFSDSVSVGSLDELLVRSAAGDPAAFARVHARTGVSVSRVVYGLLRDPSQAEEVVQEVFLEVWLTANKFTPARGPALAWMHTIAKRRAIDRIRASQASRDRDVRIGLREIVVPYDVVSETVHLREEHLRFLSLLDLLPSNERQVVDLVYLQGRSHSEVAEQLGVAAGTVKSRLHRARARLRALVDSPDAIITD